MSEYKCNHCKDSGQITLNDTKIDCYMCNDDLEYMNTEQPNIVTKDLIVQCDNPNCDHTEPVESMEHYKDFLNKPCPLCRQDVDEKEKMDRITRDRLSQIF